MGDVVVVGGTGFYGRYLVEDLLRYTDASILVVARSPGRRSSIGRVRTAAVDHRDVAALSRVVSGAAVLVHCAGPFQSMPLGPLRAALAAGCRTSTSVRTVPSAGRRWSSLPVPTYQY